MIAVFVDALGWRLYQQHGLLRERLLHAQPLQTTLGYSSACDPTILTGVSPREHGHFSFFVKAEGASPFRWLRPLAMLPSRVFDRGRIRHWISRLLAPLLGYTGYFRLYAVPFGLLRYFDYTEKRDIYEANGINGGQRTLFDALRSRRIPFHVSDWRRSEEHNIGALREAVASREIRFAYLYLAGLDGILHAEGTSGQGVATKMAWYEEQLNSLIELADASYDEVELMLFSDHGMTDVATHVDLMSVVESTGLRFGRDYVAMYDSTMARFWLLSPAAERLRDVLDAQSGGRVLSHQELAALGCDFEGDRFGELIYLLEPGGLISPSFMGKEPMAGMHGYHPGHEDSVALFASSRTPARRPTRLTDLHDLLLEAVA